MITNLGIGYNGRLGNQLFQFAALYGAAKINGYDLVIPVSNTNAKHSNTMDGKPVVYRLDLADCFEINHLLGQPSNISLMVRERHFHFDSNVLQIPDNTTLDGYFQSERYFSHCKDDLIETLRFKDEIVDKAIGLLPKNKEQLVSIHVRRGDYTYPNPYHPVLGIEYLEPAISLFEGNTFHFVVFSDDPQWCRETWGNDERFTIVDSGDSFADLCAMSMCHHNIISNSSFSWWGSYLNKNDGKKVIAPSRWFGPGYKDYILTDLYTKEMKVV